MRCPACHDEDTKVVDSRVAEEGAAIRRRRQCLACAYRFTTFERLEELPLIVAKSHGGREPFEAAKLAGGIRAASKGRPVTLEDIARLVDSIEDEVRAEGHEVTSARLGVAVLDRLRRIDEVAYLRFASVYKGFDAASDFHRELSLLKKLSSEHSG
jgi:transcriptional repressor NrdR